MDETKRTCTRTMTLWGSFVSSIPRSPEIVRFTSMLSFRMSQQASACEGVSLGAQLVPHAVTFHPVGRVWVLNPWYFYVDCFRILTGTKLVSYIQKTQYMYFNLRVGAVIMFIWNWTKLLEHEFHWSRWILILEYLSSPFSECSALEKCPSVHCLLVLHSFGACV